MKKILLYCKHDKSFSFLNKIYYIDALMKKNAQTSSTWMHALKADTHAIVMHALKSNAHMIVGHCCLPR